MPLLTNLNGQISETAQISVLDRGFLYGDSVYEVVRTFRGRHFALQEHLDRLRQSAAYLYVEIPWTDAEIQAEVEKTLERADWSDSYVRIVVTRGTESTISLQPSPALQPNLLIVISSIPPEPVLSERGLHLVVPQRLRNSKQALDPIAKTGNYLNNILALLEAQQMGAEDALLLNHCGEITEATTSNFWIVREGVVQTPPVNVGILPGITRATLLQILCQRDIPHQEIALRPADLSSVQEAFLSSSVRLLMPVRQIGDAVLPSCPGSMTRLLWQALLEEMEQHSAVPV
ncbi:aminotransferase class IV [Altericista sp. CCNU0014]|uniref:aminotransferase class IV n=1 Tax=Altericista sp. CCNU0014 TaxID=3082949 RepID=UPI00384F0A98